MGSTIRVGTCRRSALLVTEPAQSYAVDAYDGFRGSGHGARGRRHGDLVANSDSMTRRR
jgi:hypothetical protein